MRSRVIAFVVLALAGGCALSQSQGAGGAGIAPLTWKVDASPFRLTVLQGDRVILREHNGTAGPGTRLSYRIREGGAMGSLTRLVDSMPTSDGTVYTVATTDSDRKATVRVSRTSLGLRVDVALGAGTTTVRTVYEAFDARPDDHFLGTGEQRNFVDLRGQVVPLKVWHECGIAKPAPFYVSTAGYGVRFATTAIGRMSFGAVAETESCDLGSAPCEIASSAPVVQACFKTGSLSYEIYPGTPEQAVRSYAARTGRPPLPLPEQFALMKWRDVIGGERELTEDVDRLTTAGIPVGWVIIDNPWELNTCVGTLSFDPGRFPDPSQMIADLHARGIRVMMWVSPTVRDWCANDLYPPNRVFGERSLRAIDLTDPAVAASFEQRLEALLRTGIDGFKVDRGDEVDFEGQTLAGGSGGDVHNAYPVLVARSIERAARAVRGTRVPVLFRAGFTGSQSLDTGMWSGDLPGTWAGLEGAIRSAQTAGLVGYSTWGSDVGGYNSESLTPDVFVRWAQLGAISPVFEVGGAGPNATPWTLGPAAMAGLEKAAVLHYELFPYLYQLTRRASSTGVSVLRPLALRYPDDEKAWSADREILVGNDLLAAPVAAAGTTARVYLPAGMWLDLATGAKRQGPATLNRPTPLDELPLYLRRGAAIPYNLREPEIWKTPWGLADLFHPGRGGWLIAPSPTGAAGDSADYGSARLTAVGRTQRLRLVRAPRETQVVLLGDRAPRTVTIGGRSFARSTSAAALRSAAQGWAMKRGPRGGVVLKLSPTAGVSAVVLRY